MGHALAILKAPQDLRLATKVMTNSEKTGYKKRVRSETETQRLAAGSYRDFLIAQKRAMNTPTYPDAVDASLIGTYPAVTGAGGGYVWDEVLEYRVWCHPERGAADEQEGNDYYYAFATDAEALAFAETAAGAEGPLALIRQVEYIAEHEPEQ